MFLIFDTETTGLPKHYKCKMDAFDNWPKCIQIAWQLHDALGNLIEHNSFIIQPDGFSIPFDSEKIHSISNELAKQKGIPIKEALIEFNTVLDKTTFLVGQNIIFDINIIGAEFIRAGMAANFDAFNFDLLNFEDYGFQTKIKENRALVIDDLSESDKNKLHILDTCSEITTNLCKIPRGKSGKFKFPTLSELYRHLFDEDFDEAHNASADVEATSRCFFELIRRNVLKDMDLLFSNSFFHEFKNAHPETIQRLNLTHLNLKREREKIKEKEKKSMQYAYSSKEDIERHLVSLENARFVHLHNHTQYSILQSTIDIPSLIKKSASYRMPAVTITDSGNMMGCFHFIEEIKKHNEALLKDNPHNEQLIPIIGCEFNVCEDHKDKTKKDNGYQVVFLAKNKNGYQNLIQMSSISYTEGFYYVPRINRTIIQKYKEDIIVLTGGLYGEVPAKILNLGESQAEKALVWWHDEFKEDLYIELIRHHQEDEQIVNDILIKFSKKYDILTIAANNNFYLEKEDADSHDILLCIKNGELQSTPIGKGRGYRFGFPNEEYYFKNSQEMKALFSDVPEAILNIEKLIQKISPFSLKRKILLPIFDIPNSFKNKENENDDAKQGENKFLAHLVYEGVKKRYENITPQIKDQLKLELEVIAKTGYPGYFLIVMDFINKAKELGVSVGPGRGSVAGSLVSYCLGITHIDPLKYNLLFERFLNPERISMPDIDIDFDDEGRNKIIHYILDKYGSKNVAQIITYGKMGGKSAIRDTARVLNLPLFEADKISKIIPNIGLKKFAQLDDKSLSDQMSSEELEKVNRLKKILKEDSLESTTIKKAIKIEGLLRNTGIHACGLIIAPDNIDKFIPISLSKDSNMFLTQFDNSIVEKAGLLKMDLLGLNTLSIIKHACKIIKMRRDLNVDPESFPVDDQKTFELFQRGETIGIFQYESPGMRQYMKNLKPNVIEDLIALNALYRPGPFGYIKNFIDRKHGKEKITYDLPDCEKHLKETYGITVYQEQVMLLSQTLANFTKGEADILRQAMSKKDKEVLEKMKPQFIKQSTEKGYDLKKIEKIWKDWEAFAYYAFNKSHATCYTWIAYQTAYLKTHYPMEYMAAILSNKMNDIKDLSFYIAECKRMNLKILGPDVNESYEKFSVNKKGIIRFGMNAIKGIGEMAVKNIMEDREKNGNFTSVLDLAKRVNLRVCNKRVFENLALSGGFDIIETIHRAQFFAKDEKGISFLEKIIKLGYAYQENLNKMNFSLFKDENMIAILEIPAPKCDPWEKIELLSKEKEVIGVYASSHPLDDYKFEMKFTNHTLSFFENDLVKKINHRFAFASILTDVQHRISKNGNKWGILTVTDYINSHQFRIFGEYYMKFKDFLEPNSALYINGIIEKGWIQKDGSEREPKEKILDIFFLSDVFNKKCKSISIHYNLEKLKKVNILKLKKIIDPFSSKRGKQEIFFHILSDNANISAKFLSKKYKLNINAKLLNSLKKENIHFKLN